MQYLTSTSQPECGGMSAINRDVRIRAPLQTYNPIAADENAVLHVTPTTATKNANAKTAQPKKDAREE
ncbi:hypothetical protein D9613_012365 [Agrocybe pediades]|uniref:Uncharacterized protein n=1 Tax=Agrocybe pediades TaxID=84607 RepID=A0A8H4QS90_9AGAR|nr:hypothetical protein D9613_012365 [Agrocybe pediades]